MALLFKSDSDRIEWWRRELGERMPEVEVRCWPEVGDPREIEFALVWNMPRGALASFPNLRVSSRSARASIISSPTPSCRSRCRSAARSTNF
ncbi:MAG: hypothetical protein ACHQRJ_08735 [Alphaproteobacteria bacterium]